MDLFAEELTPDQEEELLEKASFEIRKRGLEMPAVMMLEMQKPVAGITNQAAIVFSPFLIPFFGFDNFNNFGRLLRTREGVEKLIRRLESDSKVSDSTTPTTGN